MFGIEELLVPSERKVRAEALVGHDIALDGGSSVGKGERSDRIGAQDSILAKMRDKTLPRQRRL